MKFTQMAHANEIERDWIELMQLIKYSEELLQKLLLS